KWRDFEASRCERPAVSQLSLAFPRSDAVGGLNLDRDINEGQSGAAKSFVFAEDQCQIASNLCVRQRYGREHVGFDVFLNIRARNKAYADICGDKALEQFAGIELHSVSRLQLALMEEIVQSVASVANLGHDQRILRDINGRGRFE